MEKEQTVAIKSICVVRLSALGDVILTVPLMHNLRAAFPQAQITWIIAKEFYPIVAGLSQVEFIVIDKPKSLREYLHYRHMWKTREFDVVLALQANLRVNMLYKMIRSPRKIGFDNHRARDLHRFFVKEQIPYKPQHLLEGFLAFLAPLGVKQKSIDWSLPLLPEDYAWGQQLCGTDNVLALHPMASKSERNWSVESYAQFINRAYKEFNYKIILTGGPSAAEKELAQSILENVTVPVNNQVGKSSLKQLAGLLRYVKVLVCPDTGPAHLASAMGTPVIGLYAVARPELSGPYFSQDLTVNKYPQAVQQFLKKEVSAVDWHQRVHHSGAMSLISVDEVIEKLERLSIIEGIA